MNKKNIVLATFSGIVGVIIGKVFFHSSKEKIEFPDTESKEKVLKFKSYYTLLNEWLKLKQENVSLETYFKSHHYSSIVIYGWGEIGKRFVKEIEHSDSIKVQYVMDQNSDMFSLSNDIILNPLDRSNDNLDAIIVTPIFEYEQIKNQLEKEYNFPIISMEDIIFELSLKSNL